MAFMPINVYNIKNNDLVCTAYRFDHSARFKTTNSKHNMHNRRVKRTISSQRTLVLFSYR